jgi:hypothetical protein
MSELQVEQAKRMVAGLRGQTKAQVFKVWVSVCLGRVHNATLAEQRKDWMIYDIVEARFGKAVADQVA